MPGPGTKSHPVHRKEAIASKFRPGKKSWRLYWRLNRVFIELGFTVEKK